MFFFTYAAFIDSFPGWRGDEESHCLDEWQTNAQESKNDGDQFCRYTSIYLPYTVKLTCSSNFHYTCIYGSTNFC